MQANYTTFMVLALLSSGCGTLPVSHAPVIDNEAAVTTYQCSGTPEDGILPASYPDLLTIKEIQARLILLGYSTGQIDGIYGKKTELGIRAYQAANHLLTDGRPSTALLEHIKNTQQASGIDLSGIIPQVARQTFE